MTILQKLIVVLGLLAADPGRQKNENWKNFSLNIRLLHFNKITCLQFN